MDWPPGGTREVPLKTGQTSCGTRCDCPTPEKTKGTLPLDRPLIDSPGCPSPRSIAEFLMALIAVGIQLGSHLVQVVDLSGFHRRDEFLGHGIHLIGQRFPQLLH